MSDIKVKWNKFKFWGKLNAKDEGKECDNNKDEVENGTTDKQKNETKEDVQTKPVKLDLKEVKEEIDQVKDKSTSQHKAGKTKGIIDSLTQTPPPETETTNQTIIIPPTKQQRLL